MSSTELRRVTNGRVLAVIAGLMIILIAWQFRNLGRYAVIPGGSDLRPIIMDTRTGTIFYMMPEIKNGAPVSLEVHPTTGEVVRHYRWEK